jgi:hypothetical protein
MDPPQETPSPGCWDRGLGSQFPTGYEVGRECILSHESEFTATGIWQLTSRPSYEGFEPSTPTFPTDTKALALNREPVDRKVGQALG